MAVNEKYLLALYDEQKEINEEHKVTIADLESLLLETQQALSEREAELVKCKEIGEKVIEEGINVNTKWGEALKRESDHVAKIAELGELFRELMQSIPKEAYDYMHKHGLFDGITEALIDNALKEADDDK